MYNLGQKQVLARAMVGGGCVGIVRASVALEGGFGWQEKGNSAGAWTSALALGSARRLPFSFHPITTSLLLTASRQAKAGNL